MSIDDLDAEWQKRKDSAPNPLSLRIHRALSWMKRANLVDADPDASFIFHWIAFNACYAKDGPRSQDVTERERFADYFHLILKLDNHDHSVFDAIWNRFPHEIRLLLNNNKVFQPFWEHHAGRGFANWETLFNNAVNDVYKALSSRNTQVILEVLFDRLYTLRIQLMHGGATWKSSVNRTQVQDGARIIEFLTPLFVHLMMCNPNEDWGTPEYPVVT